MMHRRTIHYLPILILLFFLPAVASFIVNPSTLTTTTSLQKQSTKLNLHVDPIHLHRDSLLRLDDPMLLGKESEHPKSHWTSKEIHKFTNSLAPLVLAIYIIGYYLSQHHHQNGGGGGEMMTHVPVDPMLGGGILIGAGLYMMKWSVDRTMLSPP